MSETRASQLADMLANRIVVLDGATGTMLLPVAPPGAIGPMVDYLNLRRPEIVRDLHSAYLAAGADIVKTNTFNAVPIDEMDFALADRVNRLGAQIARAAADAAERDNPTRPRFVAGVLGPTRRSASIASDPKHPDGRAVAFEALCEAYGAAARSLIEGGADLLLVETLVDSRNGAAALRAIEAARQALGVAIPVMISATVTERDERTLSGQTMAEFWDSVSAASPLAVGLNCGFGAAALAPALRSLAAAASVAVSVHPNASLPNAAGDYDDGPAMLAAFLRGFVDEGIVDIVGGCCGTTPEHIAAVAAAVRDRGPRR